MGAEESKAIARAVNHRRLVIFLRIAVAVLTLAGWEAAVDFGLIDPFFFRNHRRSGISWWCG